MSKITIKTSPKQYHRAVMGMVAAVMGMVAAALAIARKSGYHAMVDGLRKTQLSYIVEVIKDSSLPEDVEEKCIKKTLTDLYNESAEALGESSYTEVPV